MAAQDYDKCEELVLASEGGYTNNSRDPGGPTNWGITIFDARMYWRPHATAADVKAMPLSVAKDIYRKKYWAALSCDDLPPGLDYTVFDYGVNSGIGRAGRVLRKCMGLPSADWQVTPDIIAAVHKRDDKMLIKEINEERLNFLRHLNTWSVFGTGWSRRVASVEKVSLQLAGAVQVPVEQHVAEVPQGKGAHLSFDLISHIFHIGGDSK